ncbi:MAG: NAD(P)-binding protein [Negativicutes bacterium]|nr:NAD(P)-binding protein [Negativicutes bacterium]
MLRIINFRVPVEENTPLTELAARRLRLPPGGIATVAIARRAVDARRKSNIAFVYSLDVAVHTAEGQVLARLNGDKDVSIRPETRPDPLVLGSESLEHPPVIVGAGPAGLLAALLLAEHGYRPLVLERGRDVDRRSREVAQFWQSGQFDPESNVQFGEGGAGTFSDGKLTTRVNDPRLGEVLDRLIAAGAPPEIKYLHKPHIGTDMLRRVVKNLRQQIVAAGGQVEFEAKVTDIEVVDDRLTALVVNENRRIPCAVALFGIGHSARDTYQMLHRHGLAMEAKPFAIGVRIEHPQEMVDRAQYGDMAGHASLGAADYSLVYHEKTSGRTAYSFCMCPGGLVVAAASEAGGVVTNGMSHFSRASGLANSALAVNVTTADFPGVLGGIEFQRRYEELAFQCGGGGYAAPVQTVGDFLAGKASGQQFLSKPSYRPATQAADLRNCLPDFVAATLARALPDFGRRIRGFDHPGAVMTGVETRTSAPVRLLRGENQMSLNIAGLYPVGEGAGYAGGIMSAALDGMNAAVAVIKEYRPF